MFFSWYETQIILIIKWDIHIRNNKRDNHKCIVYKKLHKEFLTLMNCHNNTIINYNFHITISVLEQLSGRERVFTLVIICISIKVKN